MQSIYNLVQEDSAFFTWVFGRINILCLNFAYFNKQSHERSLKGLEQDLKFTAERMQPILTSIYKII